MLCWYGHQRDKESVGKVVKVALSCLERGGADRMLGLWALCFAGRVGEGNSIGRETLWLLRVD